MGILHAPTSESVSPTPFHLEGHAPRNANRNYYSITFQAAVPRQGSVGQEELGRQVGPQGCSTPRYSFYPVTHYRSTHLPPQRRENTLWSLLSENVGGLADNHWFFSATQAQHTHPHPVRYMNAPGSVSPANVLGPHVADNLFHTDVTFPSRRQRARQITS